jgi:7-cyano-7-deazaguanine reductase
MPPHRENDLLCVIASVSETIQSGLRGELDCFVGSLLAMTTNRGLTHIAWPFSPIMVCARSNNAPPTKRPRAMAKKTQLPDIQLGRPAAIPASPGEAVLDRVPNPHPDTDYVARFTFPEFTVMCPVTGQPDFATLVIDYVPRGYLVESKSLKLYLNSFRNHGAFHEDCTVTIGKKLVALLKPKWLRIGGYFHPRGGMPIDVFWQAGKLPSGVWVPDQGVPTYRAR